MSDSEYEEWFEDEYPEEKANRFETLRFNKKEYRDQIEIRARRAWNAALDLAQKEAQVELNHGADWFPDLLESHKVD